MMRIVRWLLQRSQAALTCGLCMAVSLSCAQESPLIDFNPNNGRSDVVTRAAHNWPIAPSPRSAQTVAGIQVLLQATGSPSSELAFGWWKGGYDSGATLVSDGVTTSAAGDAIEIVFSGLTAGTHTLTSWHNAWDSYEQNHPIAIDWRIDDSASDNPAWHAQPEVVTPTQRVQHDDLAMTAFTTVVVEPGRDVILRFRPLAREHRVVLNGLAWDSPDPAYQARVHWPVDGDEHVPADPTITWQPPRLATPTDTANARENNVTGSVDCVYHLYFGTNRERVKTATSASSDYRGSTTATAWQVDADDFMSQFFWRVDTQLPDGRLTTGSVRSFRVRQLAFPGAEGYGRFAMGGRGGRVIEVTNLEDSGPGSLREAIETEGPRTIVFRVGGTIQLKSKLLIRKPYVTIAGQTAPGDGICVRGFTFGCFGTHDVIMRFIRLRVGDQSGETMDGTGFASTDHAIFDHCSISWSIDEAVSSRGAKNITLQRSIVSEALNVANHRKYEAGKGHSFAASISGDIGSFHHNLLAHCAGRNWSLAGGLDRGGRFAGKLDIRNNVVFNWQHRTNDGGVKALNLVNNLYLPGPATRVFHLLKPDVGAPGDRQQYFVEGNRMEGYFDEQGDNWRDAVVVAAQDLAEIRLPAPFCQPNVITHTTSELLENVLADVGANLPAIDPVDQRILNDVRGCRASFQGSRTQLPGIIDSQDDVGGWPQLHSGIAPLDSDHDGLPDAWETTHGLDPHRADQNSRLKPGEVTALEVYLAELCLRPHRP